MTRLTFSVRSCLLAAALLAGLASLAPDARAQQTKRVTYDLVDVWLKPSLSHPRSPASKMSGTFVWTYPVGKFDQGTGSFTSLAIPWWGSRATPKLKITFDLKAIEFSMIGNYHGLGLDLSLRLSPPLSPYKSSPIDTTLSKFTIEVGVSHKGTVTKGSVVPRCMPPVSYGLGTAGSGKFVPTLTTSGGLPRVGNATLRVDCDRLLGGAVCLVVAGTRKIQQKVLGVTLLTDPGTGILLPVVASGSAGVAGAGALRLPLGIPKDASLIGTTLYGQTLVVDAGSPGGVFAATNGLEVLICQ